MAFFKRNIIADTTPIFEKWKKSISGFFFSFKISVQMVILYIPYQLTNTSIDNLIAKYNTNVQEINKNRYFDEMIKCKHNRKTR